MAENRWENSVADVETDPHANLATDHHPPIATVRIKFKARKRKTGRNGLEWETMAKKKT